MGKLIMTMREYKKKEQERLKNRFKNLHSNIKIKPGPGVMPRSPIPNPNAPSALQKPPDRVFKVGKVPIKRKMLSQTPVGMANASTSAKYIPPRKTRKSNRL